MDIQGIIKELKSIMDFDFEYREVIFNKYKSMLQLEINNNPYNVEASCLLAMIVCELREDIDNSLDILRQCYTRNETKFSDDAFSLWATNVSYFLIEECEEKQWKQAEDILKQAIKRNSKYANTYYALAKYYFLERDYEQAITLFHTADKISPNKIYKYCEANSLLASSQKEEGIILLKSIYSSNFYDEETDAKIALTLGRELAQKGDSEEAKKIAELLLKTEYLEFDIETDEMADFLYILGDYKACIDLYDRCNFFEDAKWLSKYFFSLKQLGKEDLAKNRLDNIIVKINEEISDIENSTDFLEEFEDYEDYQTYLISEKKRLKDIIDCYNEFFKKGRKPSASLYYDIIYKCYYINCPRHYEETSF